MRHRSDCNAIVSQAGQIAPNWGHACWWAWADVHEYLSAVHGFCIKMSCPNGWRSLGTSSFFSALHSCRAWGIHIVSHDIRAGRHVNTFRCLNSNKLITLVYRRLFFAFSPFDPKHNLNFAFRWSSVHDAVFYITFVNSRNLDGSLSVPFYTVILHLTLDMSISSIRG